MATVLRKLKSEILREGEDLAIDCEEFARIKAALTNESSVTAEELKALTEMRTEARRVCPEFDEFFFGELRKALLADGQVDHYELFQLLSLLYGGGGIDATERDFLHKLRSEMKNASPEFEAFYQQAMRDAVRQG